MCPELDHQPLAILDFTRYSGKADVSYVRAGIDNDTYAEENIVLCTDLLYELKKGESNNFHFVHSSCSL